MIGAGRFLYESWRHLSARRGQLLAKGTAFAALFSLFGALATGFTLFALLVGNDSTLYDQLLAGVAEGLPGLLKTPQDPGGAIDPDTLIQSDAMSVGGVIGLLVMLWGGLGWIDALREGVRSMYDAPKAPANIAVKKAWDVLMLALVGLGVVSSAVAGLVASSLAGPVLDAVGPSDGRFGRLVVRVLVFVAVAAVDTLLMWLILRRMSRVEIPWGDLWPGAVFGAVAIGLLKHFAGFLLARTGGNPILASGAVLVGLLFFLNLMSIVVLFAASMTHVRVEHAIRAQQAAVGALQTVDLRKPERHRDQDGSGRPKGSGWPPRWWRRLLPGGRG